MSEKGAFTMPLLKQIAAQLPNRWQTELKRIFFGREINKGTFATDEPENKILHNFLTPGDWVIDIGANVATIRSDFLN